MLKPETIKRRLRTMFERRDRMAAALVDQDIRINAQIRALCDADGTKFMRIEAARHIAFGVEEGRAA